MLLTLVERQEAGMDGRIWNAHQFEAARRAWNASLDATDTATQKALERLSVTYFYASIGMTRAGTTGEPAPAPLQVSLEDTRRGKGGATHRA